MDPNLDLLLASLPDGSLAHTIVSRLRNLPEEQWAQAIKEAAPLLTFTPRPPGGPNVA